MQCFVLTIHWRHLVTYVELHLTCIVYKHQGAPLSHRLPYDRQFRFIEILIVGIQNSQVEHLSNSLHIWQWAKVGHRSHKLAMWINQTIGMIKHINCCFQLQTDCTTLDPVSLTSQVCEVLFKGSYMKQPHWAFYWIISLYTIVLSLSSQVHRDRVDLNFPFLRKTVGAICW